jgi:hypothetical protein
LPQTRPSRGIDAHSLAAAPPRRFTISRTPGDVPERTGNFRGTGARGTGARGTGARGGAFTRGQRGGRGARARGNRGGSNRGSRGNRSRARDPTGDEEEEEVADYSVAELKRLDMVYGGFPTPYDPTTSLESLNTPVLSSPRGLVANIKYKMEVATSNTNGVHKIGGEHLTRMARGDGTVFESAEAKTIVEDFNNQIRKERAEQFGWDYTPEALRTLPEGERKVLAKRWAAGQYELPRTPELHDILGQVASYARRNETYLAEDGRKLEEKLRSLLPAQYQKADPRKPVAKPVS